MVQGPMRTPHDRALRMAGGPSPNMRRRAYFEDGGVAGESGNAGAAGVGDGNPPVIPQPPAPPAAVNAREDDDLTGRPEGLNTGTPYTGVPKPKSFQLRDAVPFGEMKHGGRSKRRGR